MIIYRRVATAKRISSKSVDEKTSVDLSNSSNISIDRVRAMSAGKPVTIAG